MNDLSIVIATVIGSIVVSAVLSTIIAFGLSHYLGKRNTPVTSTPSISNTIASSELYTQLREAQLANGVLVEQHGDDLKIIAELTAQLNEARARIPQSDAQDTRVA